MHRRDFNRLAVSAAIGGAIPTALERLSGRAMAARQQPSLRVNGARLNQHLAELSQFGKNQQGGVSRLAYSDFDKQARAQIMDWMRAAKLEPSIDYAGNIV